MTKYLDMEEALEKSEEIINAIKEGKIFIYPTDTIYGLGCNALIKQCVDKIYEIKKRPKTKPLSIIAPNIEWILKHFEVSRPVLRLYLPGPYTLLLKKKEKEYLEYLSNSDKIGIRVPEHPFTLLIEKANVPFITTSANISGKRYPTSLKEVEKELLEKADYVIEGECFHKKPSTLIDIEHNKEIIRE